MRFLLYNIRYATGSDIYFHLPFPFFGYLRKTRDNFDDIVNFINSKKPDVVGLVEVDSGSFRNNNLCQAQSLAEKIDHDHVFKQKYAIDSLLNKLPLIRSQGNAFLTSKEIKNKDFHFFGCGIKRLVVELELDNVAFLLIHLSIKFRTRHNQLRELADLIKNIKKPLIVAGDFNPLWGKHELQLFMAATGLKSANVEHLPTFPSYSPRRQLDFVLTSKEIEIENFEIPQVRFSDHLPLICDFKIKPKSE